jgi:ribosomal protein L37AE/L43A
MSKKQRKEVIKMYVKQCPECKKKSYSSCKKGEWNCPHCDHDLSNEEAQRPEED